MPENYFHRRGEGTCKTESGGQPGEVSKGGITSFHTKLKIWSHKDVMLEKRKVIRVMAFLGAELPRHEQREKTHGVRGVPGNFKRRGGQTGGAKGCPTRERDQTSGGGRNPWTGGTQQDQKGRGKGDKRGGGGEGKTRIWRGMPDGEIGGVT